MMLFILSVCCVFLLLDRKKILSQKAKLDTDFQNLRIEKERLSALLSVERENASSKLALMQQTLEEKFENISNKVLKIQKDDFSKVQQENLNTILNPFKTEILNFKSLIEKTNEVNREDKGFLKKHLDDLKNMNENLSKNADDLVNALKGNSKIQGDWGERQLKNILDMAGFEQGIDYQMQFNHIYLNIFFASS